jgi:hypothetical protein
MAFVAIKIGRRQDVRRERILTDTRPTPRARDRRPIFIATLWAAAGWLFFRVARSGRTKFRSARRSRLEKQPTDPAAAGRKPCYFRDRTLA